MTVWNVDKNAEAKTKACMSQIDALLAEVAA